MENAEINAHLERKYAIDARTATSVSGCKYCEGHREAIDRR